MADLPDDPNLEWLRNRAKQLHRERPDRRLADVHREVARHCEFASR